MKALLIRTNGMVEAVSFPEGGVEERLDWYYKQIGCSCIDIVRPYGLDAIAKANKLASVQDQYCLVVDDEALMKAEPEINLIATLLYGYHEHGQVICGDALVAKNEDTPEGIDTVGLNDLDMLKVQAGINALISMHNEKVRENNGGH